ncbi:MAG: hypothetical protein AVDCRST_MAG64-3534, partial [uncultured Phycisphaerae bacterium]
AELSPRMVRPGEGGGAAGHAGRPGGEPRGPLPARAGLQDPAAQLPLPARRDRHHRPRRAHARVRRGQDAHGRRPAAGGPGQRRQAAPDHQGRQVLPQPLRRPPAPEPVRRDRGRVARRPRAADPPHAARVRGHVL